ncbi:unnamed protein product [Adineta steineri]|uniref:Uncharacterized protein n=1 Tax=Adineta steineri TaxID=433720 RepID=A0A814FD21_9BILA|nr:unnamed protein product [Adineta steineri]
MTQCYLMNFDRFQSFLIQIDSQLQVLRINIKYDRTYLDANRWEHIISQYFSLLQNFDKIYCKDEFHRFGLKDNGPFTWQSLKIHMKINV